MITNPLSTYIGNINSRIVSRENSLARKHLTIAKGLAPVVALLDVTSDIVRQTAVTVEHLSLSVINPLGSALSYVFKDRFDDFNMKDAARSFRFSLSNAGLLATKIIALPFDFCFQTYNIYKNPADANIAASAILDWLKSKED